MNQEIANYIMQRMSKYLYNSQMIKLRDTLDESLKQSENGILEKCSQELLDMFIATKQLEGRSEKTPFHYRFNIGKMLEKSDKNVCVMNTDDIRGYLSFYQEQNGVSKATVDNVRRNLSCFFK
ncbi:MAG: phage integrase N-terminal SAM-like domain-containing protein [Lachnospiraceae bacterium]|nr:phage integrase N-terminal SAM-like domain-containing protein [Lachnospiraceae bacterium]